MKVYSCIVTGDEFFSDLFPMVEKMDGFYTVKGKSFEEGSTDGNGVDVISTHRLVEKTYAGRKEYMAYLKDYSRIILNELKTEGKSASDIELAKEELGRAIVAVSNDFDKFTCYCGESQNPDGHVALLEWVDEVEDGKPVKTPYVHYFKLGLKSMTF